MLTRYHGYSIMKIRTNSAENAEVILSHLIQLTSEDAFTIPFDDVMVTFQTAIYLLAKTAEFDTNKKTKYALKTTI